MTTVETDKNPEGNTGIFLVGVQRSGTTLLRLLLDAHSEIAIPFESMLLVDFAYRCESKYNNLTKTEDRRLLVSDLISSKGISKWVPSVGIEDINLEKCTNFSNTVEQIFSAYAKKCGKSIWGDKTPGYISDLHILNELFPNAKFIHLIRDGRDVALSLARQPWGPNSFISALRYWKEIVAWSRKMGRMLPRHRYMEIRFEHLVFDPRGALEDIMAFLDLPFEESMLERYRENLDYKLPSASHDFHKNLKRPIDPDLALKWMKILPHVDQVLSYEIAGNLFEELAYPLGCTHTAKGVVLLRKLYYWIEEKTSWRIRKFKHLL